MKTVFLFIILLLAACAVAAGSGAALADYQWFGRCRWCP